jgi:anti-repressor protein
MNLIKKTFESYDVRTLVLNSEPWFMAKDIAIILGYSETNAMVKRLDTEDIKTILRNDGSFLEQEIFGNQGSLLLINESGLYASILGSKKPEAKQFKKWVTSEVLHDSRYY